MAAVRETSFRHVDVDTAIEKATPATPPDNDAPAERSASRAWLAVLSLVALLVGLLAFFLPFITIYTGLYTFFRDTSGGFVFALTIELILVVLVIVWACFALCNDARRARLAPAPWRHAVAERGRCGKSTAYFCGPLALFLLGIVCFATPILVYLFQPTLYPAAPAPSGDTVTGGHGSTLPTGRVAVVGMGPSGTAASWMLRMGGREFDSFEANDYIGGHAYTHEAPPGSLEAPGTTRDVDMGFIFGNAGYKTFLTWLEAYGIAHINRTLETSSFDRADNKYWCNWKPTCGTVSEHTVSEIDRFMKLVDEVELNFGLTLIPFGMWLQKHGFDRDFFDDQIQAVMSILFVTKTGTWHQPTSAVINYFRKTGWVYLRPQDRPVVWNVEGGSKTFYQAMTSRIGADNIHASTPVATVKSASNGSFAVYTGDRDGTPELFGHFGDVIMATPANEALKAVHSGDRGIMMSWLLGQMQFTAAEVLLHTDQSFLPSEESGARSLYNVRWTEDGRDWRTNLEMTGLIQRVFGYADSQPELLLTVNNKSSVAGEIYKYFVWEHHTVDLWFLVLVRAYLPAINGAGRIFYAGDWTWTIGHEDAMIAGVRAACAAGIRMEADPAVATPIESAAYATLIKDHCGPEAERDDPTTGATSVNEVE